MPKKTRTTILAVACAFGLTALTAYEPAVAQPQSWTSVGAGSTANVSGIAPAGSGWVIVRDNKQPAQNRVALLDQDAVVTPLLWPGTPPSDLESIDAVPGTSDGFVALSSSGTGWVLTITADTITVDRSFRLPGALKQVEGFAMASVGGSTVAAWASRGSTTAPAQIRAATFNPSSGSFGPLTFGKVRVPYPTTQVRQVSDLKLVVGHVLVSSASDPGDRGPFTSAVYDVGTLKSIGASGKPALQLSTPREIGRYGGHKVEGIACSNGVGILGSDDESLGGAVMTASICPTADDPVPAAGTPVLADWEMNEGHGASMMTDSSGSGITGSVGDVIKTGTTVSGETAYRFPWAKPNTMPADAPRLVRVNDDRLNPGSGDFTITLRYRTTQNLGNIMQKGQYEASGGNFGIAQSQGHLTCAFRGTQGQVLVNSGIRLSDGKWHTIVCTRTGNQVTMTIDNRVTHTKTGTIGSISNEAPLTIGGKTTCDQVKIPCGFFVGDIDKIQIGKP
jgi:hypothetical protein